MSGSPQAQIDTEALTTSTRALAIIEQHVASCDRGREEENRRLATMDGKIDDLKDDVHDTSVELRKDFSDKVGRVHGRIDGLGKMLMGVLFAIMLQLVGALAALMWYVVTHPTGSLLP